MIQFFEIYVFEEDMKRENFMILAKKVDFANEILKYNCKSIVDVRRSASESRAIDFGIVFYSNSLSFFTVIITVTV